MTHLDDMPQANPIRAAYALTRAAPKMLEALTLARPLIDGSTDAGRAALRAIDRAIFAAEAGN